MSIVLHFLIINANNHLLQVPNISLFWNDQLYHNLLAKTNPLSIKLLLPKYLIKTTVKETKTIKAMALTAHSQNFKANNKLLQTITISLFKYLP